MNTGYIEIVNNRISPESRHKENNCFVCEQQNAQICRYARFSQHIRYSFSLKYNSLNFNNLTSLKSSVDEIDCYRYGISRDEANLSQFARIRLLSRDQ